MIRFAYTILYVQDVMRTVEFYKTAFGFSLKFMAPANEYAELSTGLTTLSFAAHSLAESNLPDGYRQSSSTQQAFGIEIGLATDDVPGTVDAAVQAGASLVAPVATKPWGQQVAYVRDPDGFLVEICSPMED